LVVKFDYAFKMHKILRVSDFMH